MKTRLELKKYKNLSYFTLSSFALNFSSLFSGLIVYQWVDPYYMGIWQTIILLQTYSVFLRLGIINGMNRELPYTVGQGDFQTATKYAETSLFSSLISSLLTLLMFSVAWLFVEVEQDWKLPIITALVIISAGFYNSYLLGTFRAKSDFNNLSKIQFIHAALKIFTLLIVYKYGFEGFCYREILLTVLLTMVTHFWRPMRVKPRFNFSILKTLLKTGVPIYIGSYLFNVAFSLPRLTLLKFGSVTELGLYAPVVTLFGALSVLPDSIATYFYPKMSHELGANKNPRKIWSKFLLLHFGTMLITIPVLFLGWIALPVVFQEIIPKYLESLNILKVALIAGPFLGFKIGYTALITLKSWRYVAIYIAVFLAVQFVMPLLFLAYSSPIYAVIYGQLVAFILMFGVSNVANYYAFTSYSMKV